MDLNLVKILKKYDPCRPCDDDIKIAVPIRMPRNPAPIKQILPKQPIPIRQPIQPIRNKKQI